MPVLAVRPRIAFSSGSKLQPFAAIVSAAKPQNPCTPPLPQALVAEMVGNFTKRLTEPYGINVRELTGDINLTKAEIDDTQVGD